jgi:hypothetical protein
MPGSEENISVSGVDNDSTGILNAGHDCFSVSAIQL